MIKHNEVTDEAFNETLKSNIKLVYKIVYSYNLKYGDYSIDRNDLYQEALLGFYDAMMQYNNKLGMKFSSFAYLVIKRRLNRIVSNNINIYKKEIKSIDNIANIDYHSEFAINEKENRYKEDYRINELLNLINEQEKAVFDLKIKGYSYKEIAKKTKTTVKQVDNRLTSIKRKWTRHIEKNQKMIE